jgi:hypothetical protein
LSHARSCLLAALALVGVLMAVGCGGGESPPPPSPTTTSTAEVTPGPALTPTQAVPKVTPSLGYCNPTTIDTTPYQLEVKAEWQGKDRIVIKGSVVVPSPVGLQYVICQDGELSYSLVPASQPKVADGKITAESKLVPSQRGPAFNADAKFEAVLFFMRQDVQTPMFITKIPVEGRPE